MIDPKVLVVCTGNVCRSPYLERRLQQVANGAWGSGAITVESAGTGALHASPMDPSSARLLERRALEHLDFRARQLTQPMVADAQLVLTMTRGHRGRVAALLPRAMSYIFAVADFGDLIERLPDRDMPDTDEPSEWLRQITRQASQRRGMHAPMKASDADVIDPFRCSPEVFDAMERQLERWMPALGRALGEGRSGV